MRLYWKNNKKKKKQVNFTPIDSMCEQCERAVNIRCHWIVKDIYEQHHVNTPRLFLSRVQHLRCSHLYLQPGLHDPGLSVFDWIMYRWRQRTRLPPETCWHVLRICRWVQLTSKNVSFRHHHPHTSLSPSQASAPSSHLRWCDSQSNAWSRARTQSGSSTTTPGPSPAPALASSSSFSVASPFWSSPCPRCPGILGRLAWMPSQNKWSEKPDKQMNERWEVTVSYVFEYRC